MPIVRLTDVDIERAKQIWAEYQRTHDVSDRKGHAVGVDPFTGRIWFGESGADIWRQLDEEGVDTPLYLARVGYDYYQRKGGHR